MSIVRFSKSFCRGICSKVARFWWRGNGRDRGMHWKAWNNITINKKGGGLGFKEFHIMNSPHLAKQAWRAPKNPTALWVQVLKSVYFPNKDFLQAKRKRNHSWVWASLVHGKGTLLQRARWLIGRGDKVNINESNWLVTGEIIHVELPEEVEKVEDLIDHHNSCWSINPLRNIVDNQTDIKILQTPIQWLESEDILWWPFTRTRDTLLKLVIGV